MVPVADTTPGSIGEAFDDDEDQFSRGDVFPPATAHLLHRAVVEHGLRVETEFAKLFALTGSGAAAAVTEAGRRRLATGMREDHALASVCHDVVQGWWLP